MDGNLYKYLQTLKPQDQNTLDQTIAPAVDQPTSQPAEPQVLAGSMRDILEHGIANSTAIDPDAGLTGAATGVNVSSDLNQDAAPRSPSSIPTPPASPTNPSPDTAATPSPRGFGSELNDAALKNAQAMQAANLQKSNLSKAFSTANAALGGVKPDYSFEEGLDKQSSLPIDNILARRKGLGEEQKYSNEQALQDPTSPDNQAFRDYIKQNLPGLSKSPGFDKLTLANPAMEKIAEMYTKSQDRRAALAQAQMNHQDTLAIATGKQSDLREQRAFHNKESAAKQFNSDKLWSDASKKLESLDAAESTLEEAHGNHNPLAKQAKAFDLAKSLIGGGRLAYQEVQMLTGSTGVIQRAEQAMADAMNNGMTDTNYKAFKDMATVMRKVAEKQKQKAEDRILGSYAARSGTDLGTARQQVLGDSAPASAAPQSSMSPEDQKAVNWAQANPSDPRAQKILALHGIK